VLKAAARWPAVPAAFPNLACWTASAAAASNVKFIGTAGRALPSRALCTGHLYPQTGQALPAATVEVALTTPKLRSSKDSGRGLTKCVQKCTVREPDSGGDCREADNLNLPTKGKWNLWRAEVGTVPDRDCRTRSLGGEEET
jgi:hypothetical protein